MKSYFDTNHLAGVLLAATRHAANGGLASWQIALIGVGVPLAVTVVGVLLRRVRAAHRPAPWPTS